MLGFMPLANIVNKVTTVRTFGDCIVLLWEEKVSTVIFTEDISMIMPRGQFFVL